MTILCTSYVPEGICMAADSRLTNEVVQNDVQGHTIRTVYTLSDNAQKLILLKKVKVGISSCGRAILDGKTISDYIRIFEIEQIVDGDTVKTVAEKLFEYTKRFREEVEFVVAGYEKDMPHVYVLSTQLERKNMSPDGELFYGTAWNGRWLPIGKLINNEPQMQLNFNLMPLKDAIDFTEYIVDTVIKYERFQNDIQTCGGDIDVLVITKDDSFWHKHKIYKPF